ncbi:hypothetical protein ACL9RL_07340 [Plantibacter sp. Mn2098]|uniref:hypothetical protein n=1 Tax=Plantibacter sp. Mn2098 TaxID=3395266 RepID=UPI003BC03287
MAHHRYIRYGVDDWLVVSPTLDPVGLIHRGFVTTPDTHETIEKYRVRWALHSVERTLIGYYETEAEAIAGAETIGEALRRQRDSILEFSGYLSCDKTAPSASPERRGRG